MKKCTYCAEEIQDEAIKCKHCGEYLKKSTPETVKIVEQKTAREVNRNKSNNSRKKKSYLYLLYLIIVILFIKGCAILGSWDIKIIFPIIFPIIFLIFLRLYPLKTTSVNNKNKSALVKPIKIVKSIKINHSEREREKKIKNRNGNIAGALFLVIIIIFLGFFHIVPSHMSIFPKAHFTFSYTFVNVDEVLRRYNSQSFGERIRGEEVFNHLMGKLSEEGIIGKSGSKSIDKFEF